jgi:hypothetical protein
MSNAIGLLHSAWGYLIARKCTGYEIEATSAQQIVILVHHAPFRWSDEALPKWTGSDLQRWACLAAVGETTVEFLDILRSAMSSGKRLYLFCGHRHGGSQKEARIGTWETGTVAEGASLAEHPAWLIAG